MRSGSRPAELPRFEQLEIRKLLTGVNLPLNAEPLEPFDQVVVNSVEHAFRSDGAGGVSGSLYRPDLYRFDLDRARNINLHVDAGNGTAEMSLTVTLFRDNGNGQIDYGADAQVISRAVGVEETLDAQAPLNAGTYFVLVDPGPGNTALPEGEHINSLGYRVRLTSTDSSVSGSVYNDINADGARGENESGISGRLVFADLNENGLLEDGEPRDVTGASGSYSISNLPAGSYQLRVEASNNTVFVNPGQGFYNLAIAPGQEITGLSFGLSLAPVRGPDIRVTFGGVEIEDGQTDPIIDFLTSEEDGSGVARTFRVENRGNDTLNLLNIILPDGFTLTDGLPSFLDPGESDNFTVRVNTSTAGVFSGMIRIVSNDPDEDPFNFAITGRVSDEVDPPPPPPPTGGIETPGNLTATATSTTSISLKWSDTSDGEEGFRIYRSGSASGEYELIANLDANAKEYVDNGLSPSTRYYYRVTAFDESGESSHASANAQTRGTTPPPPPPSGGDKAGNNFAQARNLKKVQGRVAFRDAVSDSDSDDYYKMKMTVKGELTVSLTGMSNDADVYIFRQRKNGMKQVGKGENWEATPERVKVIAPKGTYYIHVTQGDSGINTAYDLAIITDHDGEGTRAPYNLKQLTRTRNLPGWIGNDDASDYYSFNLKKSRSVSIALSNFTADLDVKLLDAKGKTVAISENEGLAAEAISKQLGAGRYYIYIYRFEGGESSYKMRLSPG